VKRRRASLAPQKAARQFVCLVARITIEDYIDLIDPVDSSHEQIRAAFAALERAVRRSEGVRAKEISSYEQDVENAAPKKHRPAIRRALNRLSDAESEFLTVRQQCAYLIGREVGRRVR
jgi:hypothetical protein